MSANGPKRTSLAAPHMSAFGGKADATVCGNSLSRSLLGAKRTCPFALHMSAYDPKRTCSPGLTQINANPSTWAEILYLFRWQPTRRVLN
jgi:hypothetical protein